LPVRYIAPVRKWWIPWLALCAAGLLAVVASASAGARTGVARPFTVKPAPRRGVARFQVDYAGSGRYATTYDSRPPNQGGKPDHDHAHDSGAQRWSISFHTLLTIPTCASPGAPTDPCASIGPITGARGQTTVTGRISHAHIDGLFKNQNRSVKCHLRATGPAHQPLNVTLAVSYLPRRRAISVQALDPVSDALLRLPTACPGQGDSIDGLDDNYLGPGFSFNAAYGPDRWFTSRAVVIPARVLHRATLIRIRLGNTRAGTPPRHCDVPFPSYERCTTGGRWRGVLTLRARR
jgi:hypothetical protein